MKVFAANPKGIKHYHSRLKVKIRKISEQSSRFVKKLKLNVISKEQFVIDIKAAFENNIGYAAGKNGPSEQYWMYYPILLEKEKNKDKISEYGKNLEHNFLKNTGIFPFSHEFILHYNRFYVAHLKNINSLGIFDIPRELDIINYYNLNTQLINFTLMEPDRSIPNNEKKCYLQYFKDKKILIVCPFAKFLKDRCSKEIFEGVWSKSGKKWFYPRQVEALEFPYGFDPETHRKYPTAIHLFDDIVTQIEKKDFDIALIGAAGLAIPIASHIKKMGKIGIDLGGHLQVLFGVYGKRWIKYNDTMRPYFNEWWVRMPVKYKPKQTDVCDRGAYW